MPSSAAISARAAWQLRTGIGGVLARQEAGAAGDEREAAGVLVNVYRHPCFPEIAADPCEGDTAVAEGAHGREQSLDTHVEGVIVSAADNIEARGPDLIEYR
jgi:hypothetical protein